MASRCISLYTIPALFVRARICTWHSFSRSYPFIRRGHRPYVVSVYSRYVHNTVCIASRSRLRAYCRQGALPRFRPNIYFLVYSATAHYSSGCSGWALCQRPPPIVSGALDPELRNGILIGKIRQSIYALFLTGFNPMGRAHGYLLPREPKTLLIPACVGPFDGGLLHVVQDFAL